MTRSAQPEVEFTATDGKTYTLCGKAADLPTGNYSAVQLMSGSCTSENPHVSSTAENDFLAAADLLVRENKPLFTFKFIISPDPGVEWILKK